MNLTRKAVVILVLTMAVGIAGQWNAEIGAVPWWRLIAGLFTAGLAYEFLLTRNRPLSARLADDTRLFLGRETSLGIEFDNPSRRRLEIRFVASPPEVLACDPAPRPVALAPAGPSRAQLRVRPLALGEHAWRALPARIRGPLGLAWWSRSLQLDARICVVPDTLGPRAEASAAAPGGANLRSALGAGLELKYLRDYRPGDPLRALDWKATARTSKLITRVFSEDQHLEVMILLDAGRTSRTLIDSMNQFGHYVNLAARLAEYCVASDDRVGLVTFADRPLCSLPPGRGIGAVKRLRQSLTGTEPLAVESDVLQAALHVRQLLRHRCLVVILTDLYERSATSQLAQASRLLLPNHLPLIVGLMSEDVVALSDLEAKDWLDPYRSLAGREYRRQIERSVARLAQLGAEAVTARPAELDRRVLAQYGLLRRQRRI